MFNFNRFKERCAQKGVKVGFIESQLGLYHGYFNNVRSGKNSISDLILLKTAVLLDTTPEYLAGKSDLPDPSGDNAPEQFVLSSLEKHLIEAYRLHPEMHPAIHAMLGISADETNDETTALVVRAILDIEKKDPVLSM